MLENSFAIDELEVDLLETRHEMASIPPSTCTGPPNVGSCIAISEPHITPPPSTCIPF